MITHLPNSPIVPQPKDNPNIPNPYTVENSPETPPKSPNLELAKIESGLSPFMNRMSLKRAREDQEEEPH